MNSNPKTHFGFQIVNADEKQNQVDLVFSKVAQRYDIMNDLMSLGIHHYWKWLTIYTSNIRKKSKVLDLACGSGDLSLLLCEKFYPHLDLTLADINPNMLEQAKSRLLNQGYIENIKIIETNAEQLNFPDQYFDICFIAFGLRNVTDQKKALTEIFRVIKPGGKVCILEFSKPQSKLLKTFYDWYSFHIIPKLGEWVAKDRQSYQYLVESIRMHPDQEMLKKLVLESGFDVCNVTNITHGIVALHVAYRY